MASLKHVHSYIQVKGDRDLFMCNDPNCSHYTNRKFVIGKRSSCPKCGRYLILDWDALRRVRPLCRYCRRTKEAEELNRAQNIIEKIQSDTSIPDTTISPDVFDNLNDLFDKDTSNGTKI